MSRIIVFIILKIVEISGIIFIPYGLGIMASKWDWYYNIMRFTGEPLWLIGLVLLLQLILTVLVVVLVIVALCANWKWAKRIVE